MKFTQSESVPFQSIAQTCATTGLAQSYLRAGCKAGTVPHVRSGKRILVNVPLLMERLNAQALQQMEG